MTIKIVIHTDLEIVINFFIKIFQYTHCEIVDAVIHSLFLTSFSSNKAIFIFKFIIYIQYLLILY